MDFDLVIQGGTLVTAADTVQADLAIQGEQIAAVGQGLSGRETIDARGRLVIPGAVDPHVHLQMPTAVTISSDDWETGTVAAACGGTTTVIDFVEPEPGQTLLEAFDARRAEAEGKAVIDYSLHMTLPTSHVPAALSEVPAVVAAGLTSFKAYTTYGSFKLSDEQFLAAMTAVRAAGGIIIVHCENDAIVQRCTQELLAAARTGPDAHPLSRPAVAEGEAVARVLALAEVTEAPVYIVHISTARGAQAVACARARGQAAYGETCPQYLFLTDAEYSRGRPGERPNPDPFEGAKFVCQPPLRTAADQAALWQALAAGDLQAVGTDHCPFNYVGQKDLGRDKFTRIPGGLPGIEARLALIYSGMTSYELRFTLNRWVEVCCTNPAKLFGLYPRKGSLMPGADADVVIFDPDREVTLTQAFLHENVDYTPYEGLRLRGWPVVTISRGQVLVRDGEFVGRRGQGRFLKRHRLSLAAHP